MRKNSRKTGAIAEVAVSKYLKLKGYEVVAMNFYSRYGEIDIIAKDGEILVFIEVKYRKTDKFGTPAEAVTYRKQQKIILTAQQYILEKELGEVYMRFDVAEVTGFENDIKISMIENAFGAD